MSFPPVNPRPARRRNSLSTLLTKRRVAYEWRSGGPVITVAVGLLCVLVWLVEMLTYFLAPGAFSVLVGRGGAFSPVFFLAQPWTALTSIFFHAPNLWHILFNMITLWVVGTVLEKMLGHWPYLALLLVSGLGGSAFLALWVRLTAGVSLTALGSSAYGLSGALFGLFAALFVVYRRTGVDIRSMVILLLINFALPFFTPGIAWQVHVGGFVFGGALSLLLIWRASGLRRLGLAARVWLFSGLLVLVAIVLMAVCALSFGII